MKRSQLTERFDGYDRAVSPVIGVILMVAITVILAAVIGTFVLDLGQSAGNQAPSASLTVSTDVSAENVTISHAGGDSLTDGDTRITLTNESTGNTWTADTGTTDEVFAVGEDVVLSINDGTVSASDSDVFSGRDLSGGDNNLNSGFQYTVQVIDTESQRVIFETTVTA